MLIRKSNTAASTKRQKPDKLALIKYSTFKQSKAEGMEFKRKPTKSKKYNKYEHKINHLWFFWPWFAYFEVKLSWTRFNYRIYNLLNLSIQKTEKYFQSASKAHSTLKTTILWEGPAELVSFMFYICLLKILSKCYFD